MRQLGLLAGSSPPVSVNSTSGGAASRHRIQAHRRAQVHAAAERFIPAPADRLYRYLADFRAHHPNFLPPAFSDFRVEQGAVGAGTVHSFRLTVAGRSRSYRSRVDEPEPGRVLTESDLTSSARTTFVVTPEDGGSRVRIETRWAAADGLEGLVERLLASRLLGGIYQDELRRLDRYARALGDEGAETTDPGQVP